MAQQTPRVIRNVLWNWSNFGLKIAVAFYITPILIQRLGDTSYGVWILLSSILGYYGLLNFGIDAAVVHFTSKYLAAGRRDEVGKVLQTSQVVFTVIAIAVVLLGSALSALFAFSELVFQSVFALPRALRQPFSILLVVLSLGMAASFVSRVFVSVLRATERYDLLNFVQILMLVGRTLAIVFLMGDSLVILGVIFAVSSTGAAIGVFLMARKALPPPPGEGADRQERGFEPETFRTLRGFGVYSFLNYLADQFRFYTDSLVIGQFLRLNFVTYYNLAAVIITYFRHIIGHAASPFFPVFSRYHGSRNSAALRHTFLKASKVVAYLAILVAGNIAGSTHAFLTLWVGTIVSPEHILLSYRVILVLVAPFAIELIQSMAVNLIYGMGQHHRLTALHAAEGVANLVLSILLVGKLGVLGVAFGTAIPLIVSQVWFVTRIMSGLVAVDPLRYAVRGITLPLLLGAVLGGAQMFVQKWFPIETFFDLALLTVTSSTLFVAVTLPFYFSAEERLFFADTILSWRAKRESTSEDSF